MLSKFVKLSGGVLGLATQYGSQAPATHSNLPEGDYASLDEIINAPPTAPPPPPPTAAAGVYTNDSGFNARLLADTYLLPDGGVSAVSHQPQQPAAASGSKPFPPYSTVNKQRHQTTHAHDGCEDYLDMEVNKPAIASQVPASGEVYERSLGYAPVGDRIYQAISQNASLPKAAYTKHQSNRPSSFSGSFSEGTLGFAPPPPDAAASAFSHPGAAAAATHALATDESGYLQSSDVELQQEDEYSNNNLENRQRANRSVAYPPAINHQFGNRQSTTSRQSSNSSSSKGFLPPPLPKPRTSHASSLSLAQSDNMSISGQSFTVAENGVKVHYGSRGEIPIPAVPVVSPSSEDKKNATSDVIPQQVLDDWRIGTTIPSKPETRQGKKKRLLTLRKAAIALEPEIIGYENGHRKLEFLEPLVEEFRRGNVDELVVVLDVMHGVSRSPPVLEPGKQRLTWTELLPVLVDKTSFSNNEFDARVRCLLNSFEVAEFVKPTFYNLLESLRPYMKKSGKLGYCKNKEQRAIALWEAYKKKAYKINPELKKYKASCNLYLRKTVKQK